MAKSIQVQPTKLSGKGVELVSLNNANGEFRRATHWSLYVGEDDGSYTWVKDIELDHELPYVARGKALTEAALLSMQYQVPIEPLL